MTKGFTVDRLRGFEGVPVRMRLEDGSEHTGYLRTELLSERSVSVFVAGGANGGATIYIDQIVGVWPIETS